jgi:hypothetical protein
MAIDSTEAAILQTPSTIPDGLDPAHATGMLPGLTVDDLAAIQAAGWSRIGIVAAVADPEGRLLMLEHHGNNKIKDGALGPLAETTHISWVGDTPHVEDPAMTFARGLREELGIADPAALGLRAQAAGAWVVNRWPIGGVYHEQYALAVAPIAHIGSAACKKILTSFKPTDEIDGIRFMPPADIVRIRNIRPGTVEWLGDVIASGQLTVRSHDRAPLRLPNSTIPGLGRDVRFDRIQL